MGEYRFFLWVCLILIIVGNVQAQFFTKSSKSIPRMGRRSDDSIGTNTIQSRRELIDHFIEEVGPMNLLAAIEARASSEAPIVIGEVAYRNAQPIDMTTQFDEIGGEQNNQQQRMMLVNRRSDLNSGTMGPESDRTSFAMRALNVERFMRHLASGQPLLPLNRVLLNQSNKQQQQEQQHVEQQQQQQQQTRD